MQEKKNSFGWNIAAMGVVIGNLIGWGGVAVLVFNVKGDAKQMLGSETLLLMRFFFATTILAYGLLSFIAFSFAFFAEGKERHATWKDWLLTSGYITLQIAIELLVNK